MHSLSLLSVLLFYSICTKACGGNNAFLGMDQIEQKGHKDPEGVSNCSHQKTGQPLEPYIQPIHRDVQDQSSLFNKFFLKKIV